ncbi:ABC transporter ATP-binding protein [Cnuibacter physcomitrellae]|uniref:Sugar ABC transporter ATP-binding protein n=1 Tax=Cnuibacter physcomitrellae TaxID=1619308 RepID=A0A1X9LU99_9MICO|nr:sugar ABC transporter ATP-binding protein [Cnuibacter physcomitrellae]ARJ06819.1 sugar ABC transporter ATP-binding protein [Cnuibacter physcomitrellae]MCS5497800.1 sugar ABC transporter ATP-binding protein [Cnuibacter physcomitrellae]GGI38908.1 ABC transporter ATP-binding protein [Cnuibacter physcomitrellae]
MDPTPPTTPALLDVSGATVRYGPETVLDSVDFHLRPGEIHSLMGENGAGKSTLLKAITGAIQLTSGTIRIEGDEVRFASPRHAQGAGISAVYQEVDLLPNLTVAENVFLGREPRRLGAIDHRRMRQQAAEVLASLGIEVDTASLLGTHSLALQQIVAIARAISTDVRILVLDEPTSSLDADEVAELFRVMRQLAASGVAIVFVSHFLDQVYEICDRVTVLRDGRLVGEYSTRELLRVDLVEKMLGSAGASEDVPLPEKTRHDPDVAILEGRGITVRPGIQRADITLSPGEVLGVAGLLGSGRSELARAVSGVDRLDEGRLTVAGAPRVFRSPRQAALSGIVYSSENRRSDGIIADLSVLDNITLALQAQRGVLHRMSVARRRELAQSWVDALHIRPADIDRKVGELSGGNQQKVLLARLLALAPDIVVLDEPTRGIDVGAKAEVQRLVGELADNGLAVVYISAELEEVLRVSTTVMVLRSGRVVDTLSAADLTPERLLALVARPEQGDAADG